MLGFGASVLADQVFFLALTWVALQVATPGQVGVILAAGSVPRLLILLVGGTVADDTSPKRIIVGADTGRAVVMALAAGVLLLGSMSTWQLLVVAVVIGALDGMFLPAVGAMPAQIAPTHLMSRVAALRTVTQRVAMLVGGPLAGWLIYLYGPGGAFWGSAALFALSVTFLVLLTTVGTAAPAHARRVAEPGSSPASAGRPQRAAPREAPPGGAKHDLDPPARRPAFWRRFADGLQAVRTKPVLGWLLVLVAGMNFGFAGPVTAGIPLLAAHNRWGADGAGLLLGGFGFGAAATGLGLVFVSWIPRAGLVGTSAVAVMGASLFAVSQVHTFALAMAAVLVLGLASGVFGTVAHAMVLTITPQHELGRVMGLLSLCIEGVVPLSYAAAGVLAGHWVHAPFQVGGAVIVLTTAVAMAHRSLRTFELDRPERTLAPEPAAALIE